MTSTLLLLTLPLAAPALGRAENQERPRAREHRIEEEPLRAAASNGGPVTSSSGLSFSIG
jgi:hypothetical protein